MSEKLIVKDRNNQAGFILNHAIDNSTFTRTFQKNSELQLDWTMFNDGSAAAELVTNENLVEFRGQNYVITAPNATGTPINLSTQVTAIHIGYRCDSFRVAATESVGGTLTPAQIMSHYFDGNPLGYSYSVVGNFDPATVDQLGKGTGRDGLNLVAQTWPNAILYPDNKHWTVYSPDAWFHRVGKQFTFGNNLTEVETQPDSSDSIINIIECYGSPIENNNSDNNTVQQYAIHVTYRDEDSIRKWGTHPQSDDLTIDAPTTVDTLLSAAKLQAHPNPQMQTTFNYDGSAKVSESEVWHINNPRDGYQADAKITGLVEYPNDPSQVTQITIDDSQETMLDFDLNMQRTTDSALARAKFAAKKADQWSPDISILPKVGEVDD